MQIDNLNLCNFRIYRGENFIDLQTTEGKNIVIVSGFNGYGKTTFLMSLVWCLYGRDMIKVDEIFEREIEEHGGYQKYISSSLNRLAKQEGETKFSVSLTLSKVEISAIPCKAIAICRTFDTNSSNPEKLEILLDGQSNELINEYGQEVFIRDFILPIESAKFFFFDAEKIVALAKTNKPEQRRELSKAYSEVLGIKKYEQLGDDLEKLQLRYKKDSATSHDRQKLNDSQAALENSEIETEEHQTQIADLKEKLSRLRYDSKQLQDRLIREANLISTEDVERFRERQREIEAELNRLRDELKELLDLAPFAIAGDLLGQTYEQAEQEAQANQQEFQEAEIESKTESVLNDLDRNRIASKLTVPFQIQEFYASQLRRLIRQYFSDLEEAVAVPMEKIHDFNDAERGDLRELISTLRHAYKSRFRSISKEYNMLLGEKATVGRLLHDAESKEEDAIVKDYREKKLVIEHQIQAAESEIEQRNQKIGALVAEQNQHKRLISELSTKINTSELYREKDEATRKLIGDLRTFIARFKEDKKKTLETRILKALNVLMHKKSVKRVEVDMIGEDIDIKIFNAHDHEIPKAALSMGEKQLYATALLKSLVDESNIEFPVFVDSPMQKFDEKHADNIIRFFYPTVSDQVVIFPLLKKELTREEFDKLERHINQCYLINRVREDHSRFIKVADNQLFEAYQKLYDA